jgi:2-polyprenyl-6-methoxyphenol hydroxylase-like FAD-dependent oxidoreductase
MKTILIVGGGIGGLALAGFLGRPGVRIDLIERAPEWKPVGAGITLGMNAIRLVERLGIVERIAAAGQPLRRALMTDAGGRTLSALDLEALAVRTGYPSIAIHRAALHEALLGAVDQEHVAIRLGTTLRSLDNGESGVDAEFSDGSRKRYDLVVGADGIRSQVRELTFGHVPTRYSGYTSWRFVIDAEFGHDCGEAREMLGHGRRFGIVPIGGNRIYGFACYNAPPHAGDLAAISVERFKEIFSEFGGLAPQVLSQITDERQLIHNDIEDLPGSDWHRGRVLLLGDAAHAMTPNMGQGGAMAIEDAFVLATGLQAAGSIEDAISKYLGARQERVRSILDQSYRIGRVAQLQSPFACFLRDMAIRLAPEGSIARGTERLVRESPDPALFHPVG